MGGRGVVSGWVGAVAALRAGAIPARTVSRCCASTRIGKTQKSIAVQSEMAGECGNRTHPALLSKVAVILKITEATRPHPPPVPSRDFDREFSTLYDLSDDYGTL